ncbi:hypothetical protein C8Q78DRAFT_423 [Trametes maxima]|nr:hypothetical protein C8Q78DRAFT_423 [Trametes maxima]
MVASSDTEYVSRSQAGVQASGALRYRPYITQTPATIQRSTVSTTPTFAVITSQMLNHVPVLGKVTDWRMRTGSRYSQKQPGWTVSKLPMVNLRRDDWLCHCDANCLRVHITIGLLCRTVNSPQTVSNKYARNFRPVCGGDITSTRSTNLRSDWTEGYLLPVTAPRARTHDSLMISSIMVPRLCNCSTNTPSNHPARVHSQRYSDLRLIDRTCIRMRTRLAIQVSKRRSVFDFDSGINSGPNPRAATDRVSVG